MQVSVRLFTTLRELARCRLVNLEFTSETVTVKAALEKLTQQFSRKFREYLWKDQKTVQQHLQVLLNGKSIDLLEQLDTPVKDGDEIAIIPPVGGG